MVLPLYRLWRSKLNPFRDSLLDDQVLGAVIMWVIGSLVFMVPAMLIALELAGLGCEMQSRKDLPVRSEKRNPAL
jgi:cytochrome c oxidase assembly factor CtaG